MSRAVSLRHLHTKSQWWPEFFRDFRPFFDSIPQQTSAAEARYVIRKLKLKKGSSFLDCPCGIGRHALVIAKMGIRVTAVDIAQSYLDELKTIANAKHLQITVHRQDMRSLPFRNRFDCAANLFTSFGYFENESDNLLVLRQYYRSLNPGGRFMMSIMNRDWIMKHFLPTSVARMPGLTIYQRREFDFATSHMIDEWRFKTKSTDRTHRFRLRLYSFHELKAMCESVGFVNVEGFGSRRNAPINQDRRIMYIVAAKPR